MISKLVAGFLDWLYVGIYYVGPKSIFRSIKIQT